MDEDSLEDDRDDRDDEIDFEDNDDEGSLFSDDYDVYDDGDDNADDNDDETETFTGTYDGTYEDTYEETYEYEAGEEDDGTGYSSSFSTDDQERPSVRNNDNLTGFKQRGYKKTTPLFEAIDNHYWNAVTTFLMSGRWSPGGKGKLPLVPLKEEARQWSVSLDVSGKVIGRRLPIHAALMNSAPLHVVQRLVNLYPEGLKQADSQGNLPLHWAFRVVDNDPKVIDHIFQAYPEAVLVKNKPRKSTACLGIRGLLPMECMSPVIHRGSGIVVGIGSIGSTRKSENSSGHLVKKDIFLKCQAKARELSLQKMNSTMTQKSNAASSSPPPPPPPLSAAAEAKNKSSRILDYSSNKQIVEIKRELQDLREVGSKDSSNKPRKTEDEPESPEGWATSLFKGTAYKNGSSLENNVRENLSDHSEVPTTEKESPTPSARWRKSLSKLAASTANALSSSKTNSNADDSVKTADDTVEVSLGANSPGTALKKRRFINNPFRVKIKKIKKEATAKPSGGVSVSDRSTSKFSFSAVPQSDDAPLKHRKSISSLSVSSKKSATSKLSIVSNKARNIFFKSQRPKWMIDRHQRSKSETAVKKEEDTVIFDTTQNAHEKSKTELSGGVFAAAWNFDASGVTDAMSGLLLKDTTKKSTESPDQKTRRALNFSVISTSTNTSNGPTSEDSQCKTKNDDNSRQVKKIPKGFRYTLPKRISKDNNKVTKKEALTDVDRYPDPEYEDHSSISSSCSSDYSHSSASDMESISSVSTFDSHASDEHGNDDDMPVKKTTTKRGNEKWQGLNHSWISTNQGAFSALLSQAPAQQNSKMKTQIDEEVAPNTRSAALSGPRSTAKTCRHTAYPSDEIDGLKMSKSSLKVSDLHDFSHVEAMSGAGSSHKTREPTSSPSGSVAKADLSKIGDWRSEYNQYTSSQLSGGSKETKQAPKSLTSTISKKRRGSSKKLRAILKKTHKRIKSLDGKFLRKSSIRINATEDQFSVGAGANDILHDLEAPITFNPFLLDPETSTTKSVPRKNAYTSSKSQDLPGEEEAITPRTGPVVSELAMENSDKGNTYLVRVHF